MPKILHVMSSPMGENSISNRVSTRLVEVLAASAENAVVTTRDLAKQPIGHVDEAWARAALTPPPQHTEAQKALLAESDALAGELLAADVLIVATSMHNLGVPSVLKAWIDRIVRAGLTVVPTHEGMQGMAKGKRGVLVMAAGGVYSQPPLRDMEHNATYLRHILGVLGITDLQTITVDGTASPDAEQSIARGLETAGEVAASLARSLSAASDVRRDVGLDA